MESELYVYSSNETCLKFDKNKNTWSIFVYHWLFEPTGKVDGTNFKVYTTTTEARTEMSASVGLELI
jgi:hypothetical protein